MARRVTYDWAVLKRAGFGSARKVGSAEEDAVSGGEAAVDDKLTERLLQFVPAEVLAFYVAVQSILETDGQRWAALAVGLVLTAVTVPNLRAMAYWTLPLSWMAFVAWAFGTTRVDEELFGWEDSWSAIVLVAAVFAVPALDRFFSQLARGR